jgi:hypothetical protein
MVMESNGQTLKTVFMVVERGTGKSFWTKVGVGFVNRDGSITLKLDAIPVNGTLQVRDWEPREGRETREEGAKRTDAAARDPFVPASSGTPKERRPGSLFDTAPRRAGDASEGAV